MRSASPRKPASAQMVSLCPSAPANRCWDCLRDNKPSHVRFRASLWLGDANDPWYFYMWVSDTARPTRHLVGRAVPDTFDSKGRWRARSLPDGRGSVAGHVHAAGEVASIGVEFVHQIERHGVVHLHRSRRLARGDEYVRQAVAIHIGRADIDAAAEGRVEGEELVDGGRGSSGEDVHLRPAADAGAGNDFVLAVAIEVGGDHRDAEDAIREGEEADQSAAGGVEHLDVGAAEAGRSRDDFVAGTTVEVAS